MKAGLSHLTGLVFALSSLLAAPAQAELAASVLPSSRSATVGTPVTVFASVVNAVSGTQLKVLSPNSLTPDTADAAVDCRVVIASDLPLHFDFQATNPATNEPIGEPNTALDIEANATASFVLTLIPYAEIPTTQIEFDFVCADQAPALLQPGVNTLDLSASLVSVPDLIALSDSVTGAGVAMLDDASSSGAVCPIASVGQRQNRESDRGSGVRCQVGAFALAAVNIGSHSSTLHLRATTPTGAHLKVCATDTQTGDCRNEPQSGGVDLALATGEVSTYSVFVTTSDRLALDPANSRVRMDFVDADGELRGATSIAIASSPDAWFAWRDYSNGESTLRVTGDVLAGTPCYRAQASFAPTQDSVENYSVLNVELVSTLGADQSCVQAMANVPLEFALPDYAGGDRGLIIRTPLSGPAIVPVRDSL